MSYTKVDGLVTLGLSRLLSQFKVMVDAFVAPVPDATPGEFTEDATDQVWSTGVNRLTLQAFSGDGYTFRFSTTLPAGVLMNPSTGNIAGTPTTPQTVTGHRIASGHGVPDEIGNDFTFYVAAPFPMSTLSLYYTMDDADITGTVVDDRSPYNNTGTIFGGASSVPGAAGQARAFIQASEQELRTTNITGIGMGDGDNFTVSLSVKGTIAKDASLFQVFAGDGFIAGAYRGYYIYWNGGGSRELEIRVRTGTISDPQLAVNSSAVDLYDAFHHVVFVFDQANHTGKVYIDGVLDNSEDSSTSAPFTWTDTATYGDVGRYLTDYTSCQVDELTVWHSDVGVASAVFTDAQVVVLNLLKTTGTSLKTFAGL